MKKLMELLNEYVEKHNKSGLDYTFELENDGSLFCYDDTTDHKWWAMQDEAMVICSKKFWFIKRLIQNDKIDLEGIEQRAIDFFYDESPVRWKEIRAERLIMMLSVQDNPIEYLISFLR